MSMTISIFMRDVSNSLVLQILQETANQSGRNPQINLALTPPSKCRKSIWHLFRRVSAANQSGTYSAEISRTSIRPSEGQSIAGKAESIPYGGLLHAIILKQLRHSLMTDSCIRLGQAVQACLKSKTAFLCLLGRVEACGGAHRQG